MKPDSRLQPAVILLLSALIGCAPDQSPTQPPTTEITEPSFAVTSNSWTSKAQIPSARQFLAAAVVNNAAGQPILYAIGGYAPYRSRTAVHAYNLATNSWSTTAPLPRGLDQTNGAGVIGGKLYVSGGETFTSIDDETPSTSGALYVYNPSNNTWTRKADLPWPSSAGVTGVIKNKLYVLVGICGEDSGECTADRGDGRLLQYDPSSNTWDTSLSSAPHPHRWGFGVAIDGKFYVGGGASGVQLDVYDPATNKWTTKAPLPSPQWYAAAAVASNKLFVLGGRSRFDSDGILLRTVRMYNPLTNTWNAKAQMPTARDALAAARATMNGRSYILAVSGRGASGLSRANEVYTP